MVNKPKTKNRKAKAFFFWLIYDFSGIRVIWSKILPPKEKTGRTPSTFLLWVIGIYVALYGITSQRYENRIDIIENRANAIFAQLSTDTYKNALSRISIVQNMPCPKKPYILKPRTVFSSLLGSEGRYDIMVELLKETIEDWKDKLGGVNLNGAQLQEAKFWGANLTAADLRGANLEWADLELANLTGADLQGSKGLTVEQLLVVETLYQAKNLDPKLEKELKAKKPELFENPQYPHP